MAARGIDFLVGMWLVLSVWLLPHGPAQGVNTAVCGGLAALIAAAAESYPQMRYANALLGVWLVASLGTLSGLTAPLFWSDLVSGLVLIAVGLGAVPRQVEV